MKGLTTFYVSPGLSVSGIGWGVAQLPGRRKKQKRTKKGATEKMKKWGPDGPPLARAAHGWGEDSPPQGLFFEIWGSQKGVSLRKMGVLRGSPVRPIWMNFDGFCDPGYTVTISSSRPRPPRQPGLRGEVQPYPGPRRFAPCFPIVASTDGLRISRPFHPHPSCPVEIISRPRRAISSSRPRPPRQPCFFPRIPRISLVFLISGTPISVTPT